MSRQLGAKGKVVRRFGVNLFGNPKYDRLLKRKPNKPGKDPRGPSCAMLGDYTLQLAKKRSLSNVVYRSGLAQTRTQARQFVSHGHI